MNCQDITRLIDSGKFSAITANDKRDAEAHAKTCSHCAPLWIMHASLSSTTRPPMPAELSVRCLTLAAAGKQASSSRRVSRVTAVIAGLVVLAAAASMLATGLFDTSRPPEMSRASEPKIAVEEALPSVEIAPALPVPAELHGTEVKAAPKYSLPLIPAPLRADADRKTQMDLAMRKALELYPEITQGPEVDSTFVVSLNLRANGTVLENTLAMANSTEEINTLMHKMKPLDSGRTFTGAAKGHRLEDGRALRGHLSLDFSVVSDSFDLSRANARVEQIISAERSHLMLPIARGGMNTLTVLLSADGTIQRENVEFVGREAPPQNPAADAETRAREVARKLGVGLEQIGIMGTTMIRNGATDPANLAYLRIDYAWTRRPGEVAPRIGQGDNIFLSTGVDMDAARVVVERLIPEAFLQAQRTSGPPIDVPAIVFTTDGKAVGAGRINAMSGDMSQQVQPFAPGMQVYSGRSVTVRNAGGKSVEVYFIWEATAAQKEELEKKRKTAGN
jgi:hypothetical protein